MQAEPHGRRHPFNGSLRTRLGRCVAVAFSVLGLMLTMSAPASAAPWPPGCGMYAHNPHLSSHRPGTINAEVRTVCDTPQSFVYQSAQLWQKRWWGWDRIGQKGHGQAGSITELSTYANTTYCRDMTARVTGYGVIIMANGQTASVAVQSDPVEINCP